MSGGVDGPSKDERELEELADDIELDMVYVTQLEANYRLDSSSSIGGRRTSAS